MATTAGGGGTPARRNLTLEEFRAAPHPEIWEALGTVQRGVFMDCHLAIRAATGIWVEELVPVFQKYDAILQHHQAPRP